MTVAINYTLAEIAEITGGVLKQQTPSAEIRHLLLDSRKLTFPETTVFFALHANALMNKKLILELFKKGVSSFVVAENVYSMQPEIPSANFLIVKNTLKALQDLAIFHRIQFDNLPGRSKIPVIGITGSNGKTIVKEWLNQLLENDFNIVRSPKSYNSQIGVPLSVLQLNKSHSLSIFEAGISQKGEMEILENIIKPSLGIFTNIGEAHDEGFKNKLEKINEKLKLFSNASALIFCADYGELNSAISGFKNHVSSRKALQLFSWSKKYSASLQIKDVEKSSIHSTIGAVYNGSAINISIPFTDDASIENAINCWCMLLYFNIPHEVIAQRMLQLFPIEMRLELKQGINNCSVINDSYSADITSLSIALDFLSQQQQHTRHSLILSDILQSGKTDTKLYADVASIIRQKKIHKLIAIGPKISAQKQQFSFVKESYFFESVEEFKSAFSSMHFNNETILIKGARMFKFEQVNQLLEQKVHQTILSINLNAIAHNLKEYQKLLKPSTKIMAMVKAFSYGSGSFEVANLLQFHKIDYLAVAYADEGIELRKSGVALPIMVMNPDENSFNTLVEYNLEPEIFSFSMLNALEKYLLSSAVDYFPVHIKLDTGMHRLGFDSSEVNALGELLNHSKRIKVQSVFSHLAASENPGEDEFTLHQLDTFLQSCRILTDTIGYDFLKHIANTTGISRNINLHLDMVRLGIGLYGIDNNPAMQSKLKNVTALTTTVAQVKEIKPGESVGYGRNAKVKNHTTIATVRIGYADGYPRNLSNGRGKMLLKNILVPVIGNVCMDMTILDITGITNVHEGDDVIVFGQGLPIQNIAGWANTIPYEIMTGISQRVKRVYFQE